MKQLIAVAAATLALAGNAFALEKEPFSPERFAALQEAGEVVLVDVFADWCSTCKKQQTVLDEYRVANPDKTFFILEVDFDSDKEWVRLFRAPRQSTLLLYSGDKQFWYSVAETRPEVIGAELDKAFKAAM
jgi:thioredoxin 1